MEKPAASPCVMCDEQLQLLTLFAAAAAHFEQEVAVLAACSKCASEPAGLGSVAASVIVRRAEMYRRLADLNSHVTVCGCAPDMITVR